MADATNTTNPSRRSLFSLLTATVAAVPVAAVITVSSARAAPHSQESPELLTLGDQLTALVDQHETAAALEAEALDAFERLRPTLPSELIASPHESWNLTDGAPDWVMREDGLGAVRYYRPYLLRAWIAAHPEISRHTKAGKRARKLERIAKKCEADTAEAMLVSNLEVHRDTKRDVKIAMQDLVEEIMAIEPRTSVGIGIYARAILAGGKILRYGDAPGYVERLGCGLAGALVRIEADQAV